MYKHWTPDYFVANELDCLKILDDSEAVKKIPSLNSASLDCFQHGQLVRFQGMLQDVHNPEYFFKSYQVLNRTTGEMSIGNGMYKDGACCQNHEEVLVDSTRNENSERQTWFVISTPGLNEWAKDKSVTAIENKTVNPNQTTNPSRNKRPLEDEPMDCTESIRKKEKISTDDNEAGPSRSNEDLKTPMMVSKDHILNFPIPNEKGISCIVKVYKESSYKINQIVNIVGFLSLDPSLSTIHDTEELINNIEVQTHHPPASIVPRLHAVKVIQETKQVPDDELFSKAKVRRGDLHMMLTQLLFGDKFAANYLICHLISSVYHRKDCLVLGDFSLNITHFPKEYENFTRDLYDILKQIVIKSYFLDITLENLNELSLVPKKDYDCDRLTSGVLQLSYNTHLILDETKLDAGQLTTNGIKNHKSISDLIQFQKLSYDFKFYTMEYETDIPTLILSDTKSFIPCNIQVVLKPDPEIVKIYPQVVEAAKQFLSDEVRLNDFRQYVNALKNVKFDFSEETVKIIQDDFVKMRQEDNKFSANNLHLLLIFTRLMSISHGLNSLTPEMWTKCVEMETERINRLPKSRQDTMST